MSRQFRSGPVCGVSDLSATSDTSNARSGANCSSGPEVTRILPAAEIGKADACHLAGGIAERHHRAPRAQRLITPAPPISCCRARKCSGSRYHSKEAYLWPSSPGCVHRLSTELVAPSTEVQKWRNTTARDGFARSRDLGARARPHFPWSPPLAPPAPLRLTPPRTAPQWGATVFAGFTATMTESDFSCPCIIGYGSSPSRCGVPLTRR